MSTTHRETRASPRRSRRRRGESRSGSAAGSAAGSRPCSRIEPLEPREVVVARVARRLHPRRVAARRADHADADRGVRRPDFRVRNPRDVGYSASVSSMSEKMPTPVESNCQYAMLAAVRAPAEAIAHAQFFLVHPVGRAVDRRLGAILRDLRDRRPSLRRST